MKSEEITYQRYMCHLDHHRKDDWTCDLDSDVARSSKDSQRIQKNQKPNYQVRGDQYVGKSGETCYKIE